MSSLFKSRNLLFLLVLMGSMFYNACIAAGQETGRDAHSDGRVLFISSYSYAWDTVQFQIEGIKKGIAPGVTIDYEFMDTKRFSSNNDIEQFYKGFKYRMSKLEPYDVVILGDDVALNFAIKYQKELFDKIPLVYEGVNDAELAEKAAKDPYITGVLEKLSVKENIDFACKLLPSTKNIILVSDNSVTGEAVRKSFYKYKDQYPGLDFSDINTSEFSSLELKNEFASVKENEILIFVVMTEDASGRKYKNTEAIKFICSNTKAPVFKMVEGGLGDGIIGGNVVSMEMSGEIAAQIAMKIINGTPPETFNTVIESPNIFCIDENIMRDAGLDLSLIPDNAKVINHKKTFWEEYQKVLKPGIIVMSVFILFSLLALWNGRKYKRLAGELAAAKDRLENAYYHDILTGINNRTGFKRDIAVLEKSKIPFALMMIDIDNFKYINDTYGHSAGDEALRQIATRLSEVSDVNFTPYRFAGDEFIVIARGTESSLYKEEAERCISIFREDFDLSGIKHTIHGSIGIAIYPQDTEDFNSLVVYADCAMYEVKNNSKNSYKFYKDTCNAKAGSA
ncbi:MAG: diguanylate cyclase [Lachnospiraceae bacterium]|nr:diguanylate cyclase [Lachnospiraceae bacterium]